MMKLIKNSPVTSSSFAEFMNNASFAEKKMVYKSVLCKVSEQQQAVVDKASSASA
jgi:hypothetical protein